MRTEVIVYKALKTLNDFFGPYAQSVLKDLSIAGFTFNQNQIISKSGTLTHTGDFHFSGNDPQQFLMDLQEFCFNMINSVGSGIPSRLSSIENLIWSRLENKIFILEPHHGMMTSRYREIKATVSQITPNIIGDCRDIVDKVDGFVSGPVVIMGSARTSLKYRASFTAIVGVREFEVIKTSRDLPKGKQPIELFINRLQQES